jgi:SAM-dependent methyltransferase
VVVARPGGGRRGESIRTGRQQGWRGTMASRVGAVNATESVFRGNAARLGLISFLGLYFELTLIRWAPSQVRLLAYFSNYVLIAALLGIGAGMLLAGRRQRLFVAFAPSLLGLMALIFQLEVHNFALPVDSTGQAIWNQLGREPASGAVSYGLLVGLFLLIAGVFALVGQEVGRALQPFAPLRGYSINIFGSLCGVLGFAVASLLRVSPPVWFGIGAVLLVVYFVIADLRRWRLLTAISLVGIVGIAQHAASQHPVGATRHWSSYYEIDVQPYLGTTGTQYGSDIIVNKDSHQQALDLSDKYLADPFIAGRRDIYDLPYSFVQPKRVLVVGAGTGNDVAAVLRNAPNAIVDAVEIDPVIADLGRKLHPERPYDNPNVHLHIDDARSFIQKTDAKYDLVVFGFLDSHRLFSQMSSVRMDNYVYTRENFESLKRRMAPDGVIAVTFTVHEKWIADRIFKVMDTVFDQTPLIYQGNAHGWGTTFLTGMAPLTLPASAPTIDGAVFRSQVVDSGVEHTWRYSDLRGFIDPAEFASAEPLLTDDWPYLYMRERTVPSNYLLVILLTILVSVPAVLLTAPRISFRRFSNWNFLFLGAAFALLETRGITEIALVFGSTWLTNSIVISAVLLMALIANLVVGRITWIPTRAVYVALFGALLLNYFVSPRVLLDYGFAAQLLGAGLAVAGPMFFSGIIFARWFSQVDDPSSALGANLIGAVIGGLLEYASLRIGLRELYLLALAFYGLSFGLTFRTVTRDILEPAPIGGAVEVYAD